MHQMKNRNTFSPYSSMSSNSHHGDSKMDTMMMMKNMMKNDDYSSSSYNSDNAFDMISDMFDQQSNYKSSSDYNNQMGRMSQFKMFSKCCEKAKMKLCMHQDIKNKVESNFGPMEDILQETQLTEHEFFPL